MACGIAKWILIALRATNRFVQIGSILATFFVLAQLVFTSATYGLFMHDLPNRVEPGIVYIEAEGLISALITIIFASLSLVFHLVDDFLGCPMEFMSIPKRDMILATLLAMTVYLAGGAIYMKIEGWKFHEAFYFTIVFLTTIGYGHVNVRTTTGYLWSIFFVGC
jgi:hypothetical protein